MMHKIVVLGAGYAGLPAAKRFARQVYADEVQVTLINSSSVFLERPRLHQLATGQRLRTRELAEYFAGTGVTVRIGTVTDIDLDRRRVRVDAGSEPTDHSYDTLVYALGGNVDLDAVPGVRTHAHALTGVEAAERLRAELTDVANGGGTAVVGSGGMTGIEIAESFPQVRVQLVSRRRPGDWLSERAQLYLGRTLDALGRTGYRRGARRADRGGTRGPDGPRRHDRAPVRPLRVGGRILGTRTGPRLRTRRRRVGSRAGGPYYAVSVAPRRLCDR